MAFGFRKRCLQAIEPCLEDGEQLEVFVWARSTGTVEQALFRQASIPSWIITLTDRRIIVHEGDNYRANRSRLLGSFPRDRVRRIDTGAKPRSKLTLSFDGDEGHTFLIQLMWSKDAAALAASLDADAAAGDAGAADAS